MKKRKGYRAGTSSVRQDYRQGGRVKLYGGGDGDPGIGIVGEPGTSFDGPSLEEIEAQLQAAKDLEKKKQEQLKEQERRAAMSEEKENRAKRTGVMTEDIARGDLPVGQATVPTPQKINTTGTEITPTQAAALQVNETPTPITAPTIQAPQTEQVTTADVTPPIAAPEPMVTATQTVSKVPETAVVESAQGSVSTEVSNALSQAAGVANVDPIATASVTVTPGLLQERVVGTISAEAKAQAAKVAGTSLGRITRAKKQLRNSGLTEAEISALGNDPETLEANLLEFTEEERGIIEGLPEDALVSTQIDALLTGIENGQIPTWASPAVSSVEQMLAERGLSASTVGRDGLLNAIITSALPIAQSNAQAIQNSVAQDKNIEATANIKNAELSQQTAMFNAQNVFSMDMAQFNADQQRAVNNSKFLQTVALTNASNEQQSAVQNAVLMSQRNLAEADQNTKLGIQNAQAFLQMDLTNLSNTQQSGILKAQQIQQQLLSNQAATNAAGQFNATSQNQVNQFMTSLRSQTDQFNAQQSSAMSQFNAAAKNAAAARDAQRNADVDKNNAAMALQVDQFNNQQIFQREQFNVQNATAIAQSNVAWRRQANTANTAAVNAVNQQNAQNAFNLSAQAQANLWQELRDEADYTFKRWDNDEARKTSLMIAALSNESGTTGTNNFSTNVAAITKLAKDWLNL